VPVRLVPKARVASALGLFAFAIAACAPTDLHARAREDDRRDATGVFTWLVDHEPSTVVAWHVPVDEVQGVLPQSRIVAAAQTKVCQQSARAHALLLLVEGSQTTHDRDIAEDCGFALYRDEGAIVVAPR
jgi:hypothetical protein